MGDQKNAGAWARLVSASPRQGGQPAGLRRELELMGIGTGLVPGLSKLAQGGLP